ncbi:unnamed protein product [Calypogeia fissa]
MADMDMEGADGAEWVVDAAISTALVIFAGLMSGLTLGLMSLDAVDLEVLQRSGTPSEKKQAAAIAPVVQKQHQLLVTLLLCNAAAMEALPIFLDNMFHPVVAVILSVTFVLAFGEVIPQAICSRYGLAVGFYMLWLVKFLMVVCFPISYPVGKVLDYLLGHNDSALFRRAQLKALVSIHGAEAGKGGELTHDETTIISGALDLTEKTAEEAMTPIESTFSIDVNSKLDWEAMGKILARGHSRVPVYDGNPRNIIGLLLVKSLLTVRAEAETPVSAVSIRRIPRVPADLPLYDMLNEFQKGSSHMAAVVKTKYKRKPTKRSALAEALFPVDDKTPMDGEGKASKKEVAPDVEKGHVEISVEPQIDSGGATADNQYSGPGISEVDNHKVDNQEESKKREDGNAQISGHGGDEVDEGEVIGIITMEDVIEELLQEEIVDETDEYVDVHNRIRVAAVAASMSRGGSFANRDGSVKKLLQIGSYKDGNKIRFTSVDSSKREGSAATGQADSLRQPLLQPTVPVVEEEP